MSGDRLVNDAGVSTSFRKNLVESKGSVNGQWRLSLIRTAVTPNSNSQLIFVGLCFLNRRLPAGVLPLRPESLAASNG